MRHGGLPEHLLVGCLPKHDTPHPSHPGRVHSKRRVHGMGARLSHGLFIGTTLLTMRSALLLITEETHQVCTGELDDSYRGR